MSADQGIGLALPRTRVMGDRAVLVECGSLDAALRVFRVLDRMSRSGRLPVSELVPAAETVLVVGDETGAVVLGEKLARLLEGAAAEGSESVAEAGAPAQADVVIPVVYDGEDLAEVAGLTGMSVDQVVERHTAAAYTVAFTGFAPGFAYLAGGDPALSVSRRATPRPRIPAGAVGLAGRFSGVYPRRSPGGWQLIGRTGLAMWDLDREPPALLTPGRAVRFEARREVARVSGPRPEPPRLADPAPAADLTPAAEPGSAADPAPMVALPVLRIVDPGLIALVQDAGRPGLAGLGVSSSGAADRGSLRRANRLVGNGENTAALELGPGGFIAEAVGTAVLALAGAPRQGSVTGPFGDRAVPADRAFRVDAGETLRLGAPARGLRTVLAVRGGVAAQTVLGSASRDTLAELGPEPLAAGDLVRAVPQEGSGGLRPVGLPEAAPSGLDAPSGPDTPAEPPAPGEVVTLHVAPGPREYWFDAGSRARFRDTDWTVTPRSDRVGVRLDGRPLTREPAHRGRELPSEGLVRGAIQVPPEGRPVLFLADHPLTGGYPVIGVVRDDDLDLAAQLPPGALVRFAVSNGGAR